VSKVNVYEQPSQLSRARVAEKPRRRSFDAARFAWCGAITSLKKRGKKIVAVGFEGTEMAVHFR
jgi:hypothetical protein